MILRCFIVCCALAAWLQPSFAQSATDPVTQLAPVHVTATRANAAEIDVPQTIDRYDNEQISSTGAFNVGEFLESLPTRDEGSAPLVLVDGRPTFLDPTTLPLGLIASVEVSRDGSMPHLGAFNRGGVINITLKKNYVGRELGGKPVGSFAGGGGQRTLRASTTSTRGSWRTIVTFELQRTLPLAAVDRDFSREQDHRTRGGRDLRLAWGYPATLRSTAGPLPGLGSTVALVREGNGFLAGDPALGDDARNQRRFNTAPFRNLTSPNERAALETQVTWRPADRLELTLSGSFHRNRSTRLGAPPVSPASAATRVPAHLSPFGVPVELGLVHLEFGPTRQNQRSERLQLGLGATGRFAERWQWEASVGYRRNERAQRTLDLDVEKFSAALASTDPARRFDPFVDASTRVVNAALYSELTGERHSASTSGRSEVELTARGPLVKLPGGDLFARTDLEHTRETETRVSNARVGEPPTRSSASPADTEWSGSLVAPFVGRENSRPGLRRLEAQVAGQFTAETTGERAHEYEAGLVWAPVSTLSFRIRQTWETEEPVRVIAGGTEILVGEAIVDPRRGGETALDVAAITRDTVTATPQRSRRFGVGVTWEPKAVRGLKLATNFRARERTGVFEDEFTPQDVVNNEALFRERVLRAPASSDDLARGWPGPVTGVDLTPGSTGDSRRHELEFSMEYRGPERPFGKLRATLSAERTLVSRYEILPGTPFVQEGGGDYRRPKWNGDALVAWTRDAWNASLRVRHTGALAAAPGVDLGLAAFTTCDLNVGWKHRSATSDRRAREWRLNATVGNLFDAPPPWADTVAGFRGGSPLGRTYAASCTLEF